MFGEVSLAVSPGSQEVFLSPGETIEGEFSVFSLGTNGESAKFSVSVAPMTVEDEYFTLDFEDRTFASEILDWIELEEKEGTASADSPAVVRYRISVPEDAPSGGQYAALLIEAIPSASDSGDSSSVAIQSAARIAVLLYGTVSGETRVEGTVIENNISGFYLNSPVTVSSLLSNTGNIHLSARQTVHVYPLFSDEEIYSSEENATSSIVIPGTRLFSERTWEETPLLGVFRVEQEIDFGDLITVEKKLSVVCPTWFLLLVVAFLGSLILAVVERTLKRRKAREKSAKKSKENLKNPPKKSLTK